MQLVPKILGLDIKLATNTYKLQKYIESILQYLYVLG